MATIMRVWRLGRTQFQGGKDGFYNTCSDSYRDYFSDFSMGTDKVDGDRARD